MTLLAAVDIGSNAIRFAAAQCEHGQLSVIYRDRQAIRLGADVFAGGRISPQTLGRMIRVMGRFARRCRKKLGVTRLRAIATSAMREAANSDEVIAAVQAATDVQIEVIDGEQEARLIHLAISQVIDLTGRSVLLVDLGGGSGEISILCQGQRVASDTLPIGAVRLSQQLAQRGLDESSLLQLLEPMAQRVGQLIRQACQEGTIDCCIGTGGNAEALAMLDPAANESPNCLVLDRLVQYRRALESLSIDQRMARYQLRPDRADVIVCAAHVLEMVLREAGCSVMQVPQVSLVDGVLWEMAGGG